MAAPLFTDEADPVERLQRTHEALIGDEGPPPRDAGRPAAGREPLHPARRVLARRAANVPAVDRRAGRPPWNLVISNVPGPQFPLYCAGARLVAHYPVSVITDGMGLNITVMSYLGHIDFGIVADRDQIADVWCLVDWLNDAIAELEKATPSD